MSKKLVVLFVISVFVVVGLSVDFRNQILNHFVGFSLQMIYIQVSALIFVAVVEFISVGWNASSARKITRPSASVRRDIAVYFLDLTSITALIGKVLVFGVPYFFIPVAYAAIHLYVPFSFSSIISSPIAQFALLLVLSDLMLYWMHRLFHSVEATWELHQYHHSATEFCIMTSSRDNPIVGPLWVFFVGLPSIFFGASMEVSYALVWLGITHAYLLHSEIRSTWGWIGKWVFVSPQAHRIHHSLARKHWGKNFGFLLVVWDRIFGTYYLTSEHVKEIGIDSDYYNKHNLLVEMGVGIYRSGKAITQAVVKGLLMVKLSIK
jgi:sterol desaturase/sphingolipid hydroxylase (fatty acid hydroxylase superfamily)